MKKFFCFSVPHLSRWFSEEEGKKCLCCSEDMQDWLLDVFICYHQHWLLPGGSMSGATECQVIVLEAEEMQSMQYMVKSDKFLTWCISRHASASSNGSPSPVHFLCFCSNIWSPSEQLCIMSGSPALAVERGTPEWPQTSKEKLVFFCLIWSGRGNQRTVRRSTADLYIPDIVTVELKLSIITPKPSVGSLSPWLTRNSFGIKLLYDQVSVNEEDCIKRRVPSMSSMCMSHECCVLNIDSVFTSCFGFQKKIALKRRDSQSLGCHTARLRWPQQTFH